MSKKISTPIVIIHFQPLELYPPIINLLNYLGKSTGEETIIITTANSKGNILKSYKSPSRNIKIKRTPGIAAASRFRIFNYAFFYLKSVWLLIKNRPGSVLYFETISSWPAMMYKKLRGKKVKLLVHYHEYTSPLEYAGNMRLVTWMHKMEVKMYPAKYNWISHTNKMRLKKFIEDHQLPQTNPSIFHAVPNYPSKYWSKEQTVFNSSEKIRLVYVGSLGYDTMYLKETVEWILLNKEFLSLDLYAYNIDKKAHHFFQKINDNCIRLHGGYDYEVLPGILKNYDIGLVLYKPVSENWIQNAPNKIFEYLACGLDVWFPKTMTWSLSLARENEYPKIIPLNFEQLDKFDFNKAISRVGLTPAETNYYCEEIYTEIKQGLETAQCN